MLLMGNHEYRNTVDYFGKCRGSKQWHFFASHWRHNERDVISNHQPHDCLLNRLFRRRPKKTQKAPRHWWSFHFMPLSCSYNWYAHTRQFVYWFFVRFCVLRGEMRGDMMAGNQCQCHKYNVNHKICTRISLKHECRRTIHHNISNLVKNYVIFLSYISWHA